MNQAAGANEGEKQVQQDREEIERLRDLVATMQSAFLRSSLLPAGSIDLELKQFGAAFEHVTLASVSRTYKQDC